MVYGLHTCVRKQMFVRHIAKGSMLAGVPLVGGTVYAAGDTDDKKTVPISQLPLYGSPKEEVVVLPEKISTFRSGVSVVRQQVFGWWQSVEGTANKVGDVYSTGKAHTISTVDYIRTEDGVLPRMAIITLSGLGGVVLGYRGGVVRKTLFGTAAAFAATTLCYPNEAVEISKSTFDSLMKKSGLAEKFKKDDS